MQKYFGKCVCCWSQVCELMGICKSAGSVCLSNVRELMCRMGSRSTTHPLTHLHSWPANNSHHHHQHQPLRLPQLKTAGGGRAFVFSCGEIGLCTQCTGAHPPWEVGSPFCDGWLWEAGGGGGRYPVPTAKGFFSLICGGWVAAVSCFLHPTPFQLPRVIFWG